jgi:cell division protein FtsZ
VEAAQAAMASPLLEEGAIDGARGILINITGSSTLKLSEVNAASSLIQTSAHEDANIIFGAVLDEKMGDDVKITVIATGFRDQMPERRSRMLDVEAIPVVSVPVVAPDSWMKDSNPAPLRFLSEVEEEAAPKLEAWSPTTSAVVPESEISPVMASSPVPVAPVPVPTPQHWQPEPEAVPAPTSRFAYEPETPSAPARPRFAELAEPASSGSNPAHTYAPLPRDYASEIPSNVPERSPNTAASIYGLASTPEHQDLDVPAFLRRGQF